MINLTEKVSKLVNERKISIFNAFTLAKLPLEKQDQFIDEALIASNFIDKINKYVEGIK